jgi:cell division protein FtsI (penicillin-binding protein 3)
MDAQSGTVILMEVATGHVKAIVNLDREKDGSFSERFNHAVGLREVPGSTMKLASIMAGLEDGKFKITDKVNAVGSYQVYRKTFTDANDGRGYGTITIQQAFEKSSNVIALILYKAYRNDPNLFIQRLGEFGLTEPLGTEIPGELGPKFFTPGSSGWSPYSIPSMAIGYEYQQSPLHTCAFYNAVANNGKFLRPLFVKEIRRAGKIIKRMKPVVIREKICSDATLKIMQNCLKGVMSRGTGKKLTSSQFSIAGKTGTARLLNDKSQYVEENQSDFQASFAGYFPANNPKYTCVVVVTRPKKQKYAALVAGPVFAAIANKIYASNLTYHPAINERKPFAPGLPSVKGGYYRDVTQVLKHLGVRFQLNTSAKWVQADSLNNSIHLNAVQIRKSGVPNVKGMTAKDAVYLLELKGLSVSLKGYGRVVSQSLNPGTEIHKGQLVKLELK